MASVEYMEDSSGANQQQQQQQNRLATFTIAESTGTTANMLAPSPLAGQQFQTLRLNIGAAMSAGHEADGLSPALPSLVHLPLCRQSAAVTGLRYRNLGKSGLRVSNVGLGAHYHLYCLSSVFFLVGACRICHLCGI